MRKTYRGTDVEVTFDLDICIHVGECLRGEPAVFQLKRRPWVLPDAGRSDAIAEVIHLCPSGALQYRRLDGGPAETHEGTTATPIKNGPLLVVVDATGKKNPVSIGRQAAKLLGKLPNVAAVSRPIANSTGDVSIIQVTPKSGPSSQATKSLLNLIRTRAAEAKKKYHVAGYVTGPTAVNADTSNKLTSALPVFLLLIVGIAFLLLVVVFRALLVPLVAVLGFLLTIGATLGAVTWVFQDGHGLTQLGVDKTSPVVSFVPVLAVAILFGLAMDYEVFLVSRMHEAHTRGASATDATVTGFSDSARVVTSAAVIMISVFASFISGADVVIKSVAFALTFGIIFDAFLVRLTLIPALHRLLGNRAWWLPRPLDQTLPNLDIEGENLTGTAG